MDVHGLPPAVSTFLNLQSGGDAGYEGGDAESFEESPELLPSVQLNASEADLPEGLEYLLPNPLTRLKLASQRLYAQQQQLERQQTLVAHWFPDGQLAKLQNRLGQRQDTLARKQQSLQTAMQAQVTTGLNPMGQQLFWLSALMERLLTLIQQLIRQLQAVWAERFQKPRPPDPQELLTLAKLPLTTAEQAIIVNRFYGSLHE